MRTPPVPESYLRLWVTGTEEDAIRVLDSLDQDAFDENGVDVTYLGSALLAFELDVPEQDRCQLLIGLRGDQGEIDKGVEFVNAQEGVEANRTQVLEVESYISSRTQPAEPLELFDD